MRNVFFPSASCLAFLSLVWQLGFAHRERDKMGGLVGWGRSKEPKRVPKNSPDVRLSLSVCAHTPACDNSPRFAMPTPLYSLPDVPLEARSGWCLSSRREALPSALVRFLRRLWARISTSCFSASGLSVGRSNDLVVPAIDIIRTRTRAHPRSFWYMRLAPWPLFARVPVCPRACPQTPRIAPPPRSAITGPSLDLQAARPYRPHLGPTGCVKAAGELGRSHAGDPGQLRTQIVCKCHRFSSRPALPYTDIRTRITCPRYALPVYKSCRGHERPDYTWSHGIALRSRLARDLDPTCGQWIADDVHNLASSSIGLATK